jgi:adenylosuccinate synthase
MKIAPKGHTCVIGLGWGDEGKGKVVDLLCAVSDLVVRYNGGANAGHTVCAGGEKFALHLLPTGVLHEDVTAVIGPGVVVDPLKLIDEIDGLAQRGIDVTPRLKISDRAHLVLAYHKIEDQLTEQGAGEAGKIGTTARGIGPCYADKMRRTTAIRFADLLYEETLEKRVHDIVSFKKIVLRAVFGNDGGLDADGVAADIERARKRLNPCIGDTTALLHEAIESGKRILFEGANGVLLDVDHGTYPYVTSSGTGSYGIGGGAGVWPGYVSRVVGVCKAYATRVGSGPFVTELKNEIGDRIRVSGNEFGTTTGRPRRCGWFDAVACRYAARIAGATDLALLHLDTLSGFEEIGVCVGYSLDGVTLTYPPAHTHLLERVEPIFEMLPGWTEEIRDVRRFEDLPAAARAYVQRIEALVGVDVSLIGVGPDRLQTLLRGRMQDVISTPQTASP